MQFLNKLNTYIRCHVLLSWKSEKCIILKFIPACLCLMWGIGPQIRVFTEYSTRLTSIMSRRQTTLSSAESVSMLMSLTSGLTAVLQAFFWRQGCFIAEKIKSARKETDTEQWHPEVLTTSKGNGISSARAEVFGCFTKARYYIHDVKSSL